MHLATRQLRPDPYQPLARALPVAERVQGLILYRLRGDMRRLLARQGCVRVLDLGCGSGCLSCRLAGAGFQMVGLDASSAMVRRAKRKSHDFGLVQGDATGLPFGRCFDAVVLSLALHEMAPATRESVWSQMLRVLRPGGLLVFADFIAGSFTSSYARAVASLIDRDERRIGRIHRPHYENFRQFMNAGGLGAWLATRAATSVLERSYWGSNIGLIAVAPA